MSDKKQSEIRKVATPKQTGGGGFVFEDKVTAYFCSHFLGDTLSLAYNLGKITRIDFQVRAEGWLFDDLLLTQMSPKGEIARIAVSIKSNVQFNSSGPSDDLLSDLWNQFVGEPKKVFDPLKDYLCIVNSIIPSSIFDDLMSLLNSAKTMDPQVFNERISKEDGGFSLTKRELFSHFHCPAVIASKHKIKDDNTVLLLSRLFFLQFDFESPNSNSENAIISVTQNILSEPDGENEVRLYESLCRIRSEFAPKSGYLDYETLITKFRHQYNLKGFPNHRSDWQKIYSTSSTKLSSIPDSIGGKLNLPRTAELDSLRTYIDSNEVVFVLGKSGFGKSVLVKKLIEREADIQDNYIWIDAQSISTGTLSQYFGIQHSISELFKYSHKSFSYLIIDGVDRFFKEEQLSQLYEIVTVATAPESGWKMILTCQNDDYADVLLRFYRINVSLKSESYNVNLNVYDYLSDIKKEFPELSDLFKHKHLHSVLNNLKYLDWLAVKLVSGTIIPEKDLIGETTIIDWIWKEEFDSSGSRFMQQYSEIQAQSFSSGVPVTDFTISDLTPLDSLKAQKNIYDKDDKLYLGHDLLGDWARYKLLRSKDKNLKTYLLSMELASPLWRKAIRLYGIYLLEKKDNAAAWKSIMSQLSELEQDEKIIQDLLLESIFYSSDTYSHLTLVIDYLKEENGKIFKRVIEQFLIKATLPNQDVMKIAKELGSFTVAEAASYHRIPDFLYWPDVIKFLYDNKTETIKLSRRKIADLCLMWLEYTPVEFSYREEVTSIALENAEWVSEFNFKAGYSSNKDGRYVYKAFLAGINEYPEQVIELALKLCKRITIERTERTDSENEIIEGPPRSIFSGAKVRDKIQWPDGPYENVDDLFAKVCLNDNALNPMILKFPEKAAEILLALLIEPPREVSFDFCSSHYHLDVVDPAGWFPPFYNRGPFLYFIKNQSTKGLDVIIRLVNFATQQWTNDFNHKKEAIPFMEMSYDGEIRKYIGDNRTYYWFRDAVVATHAVVSALEALEKFLIDQIDEKAPIDKYVDIILKNGTSAAFLGILSSVGKYSPKLFLGPLKPMLAVLDFYFLEKDLDFGGAGIEGHQMVGSGFFDSTTFKLAKEWHEMPHRKRSIGGIAIELFCLDIELQQFYKEITKEWSITLEEIADDARTSDYLMRIISFFTIENYVKIVEDGKECLMYKEPELLAAKLKVARIDAQQGLDLMAFPIQCLKSVENGLKLDLNDCKELWNNVLTVSKREDDDPYGAFGGRHRAVLAGCGLLFYNKDIWIKEYPQIIKWTVSYTENVLENYIPDPYSFSQMDMRDSWSAFAARILASAWSTDLKNKRLRNSIAILVIKCPYDSISVLFSETAKYMSWSESNFVQLQNLVILWAIGIDKKHYYSLPQYQIEDLSEDKSFLKKLLSKILGRNHINKEKGFDINYYRESLIKDFSNARISEKLIDWSKTPDVKFQRKGHLPFQIDISHRSGISKVILQHAFAGAPDIDNLPQADRNHLCQLWKQILEQITFELGPVAEIQLKKNEYPDEFDRWALERISRLILDLKTEDNFDSDEFWKPIFAYGHLASKWIVIFMENYFVSNIEREDKREAFYNKWISLIEFADSCETWESEMSYWVKEIQESLMGISGSMIMWWKNDNYSFFYDKAILKIIKWAEKKAYDQDAVYRILSLLMTKPGMKFLKEGLMIVSKHLNFQKLGDKAGVREGYVKREFTHENYLAKTSSYLWENYRTEITADTEILNYFKEIVTYLVSKQNPIGLELQDRILI